MIDYLNIINEPNYVNMYARVLTFSYIQKKIPQVKANHDILYRKHHNLFFWKITI